NVFRAASSKRPTVRNESRAMRINRLTRDCVRLKSTATAKMTMLARIIRLLADGAVVAVLAAGLIGHLARDRIVAIAALTYLPLVPISAAALLYDLIRRGRTTGSHQPYRLAGLSGLSLAWALSGMWGWHTAPAPAQPRPPVRAILQNVWWGGGWDRSPETWKETYDGLMAENADVLFLAEAPERPWFVPLADKAGWSFALAEHDPVEATWFRLVIMSRWPHRTMQTKRFPRGAGLVVHIDRPKAPFVVMMVDGRSWPTRDRAQDLAAVWRFIAEHNTKTPIDIIAGDFNAPARSVGFDAFREQYWLLNETCGTWRGTWPRSLPLVDVDQVWIRKGWTAEDCRFRSTPHTDHIGLSATFR
ncbi:MAG: endonuclease/exonuclease/phosphatase family protein, partial [Myxococcota bacterium]